MSWNPNTSTLAWVRGPWAFRRARFVCLLLGHRWLSSAELYGARHVDLIPWAGACDRCGVTFDADSDPRKGGRK